MIIELDFNNVNDKNDFHQIIQKQFDFEDYGYNLDSLYDLLTSFTDSLTIKIYNIDKVNESINNYINVFKSLLNDIVNECSNISIMYK